MTTRLLLFALALITFNAFSTLIFEDPLDGSKLCNNLSTTFSIPEDYQGKYDYDITIVKSDTSNDLFINYYLTKNAAVDTLKEITHPLNDSFSEESLSLSLNPWWLITYKLFVDGKEKFSESKSGFPFKECFEYKSECNKVTAYKKSVRAICSSTTFTPKHYANLQNDSLHFIFFDSTSQSNITCQAIGYYVNTDSIVASNLPPHLYTVRVFDKEIYPTIPFPSRYYLDKKIQGEADLRTCPPIGENTGYKGSALCNNLEATYKLPYPLVGSYTVETQIEASADSLVIHHFLIEDDSKEEIERIHTDLSSYFNTTGLVGERDIQVVYNLYINTNFFATNSFTMNPYNTCYEIDDKCIELNVYRKSLREICPTTGVKTKKFIEVQEDIVMVDFIDSTYKLEVTCFAEGYYVHKDSIKVTELDGLKNIDYRVFLGTHIECVLGICPHIVLYQPQIGNAYFSNCIINAFEDEQNKEQFVFPNPAQDYISIKGVQGDVILTNQVGQQFSLQGTNQLSIGNLPRGMYIATFIANGKTIREKIIIQ